MKDYYLIKLCKYNDDYTYETIICKCQINISIETSLLSTLIHCKN